MYYQDKFDYTTTEEGNFKTNKIVVADGLEFNFYETVRLATLYKNSAYSSGKDDNKPFKNITRPLLNLQYRAEGFDVKDIILFINDAYEYYKSFLVRKFHDKWARENKIDTFIDEMVESYVDYGLALVKNVNATRPEVVPLLRLAFCDQTDILSGPICEKHYYSPDQLRDMSSQGWQNIEEVIQLAENEKKQWITSGKTNKTPGKYIEVYELHGTLPDWWLDDAKDKSTDQPDYVSQVQIFTFYKNSQDQKKGMTLFSGKEKESIYKAIARDPIYGRALGLGGAEELFEAQVWTNYDILRIKGLLDAAAKVLYKTDDSTFAGRNKTSDMENGEIMVVAKGSDLAQVNTSPVNISLFEKAMMEWDAHAKEMAGASEAILGESPDSGTPFALQNLVVQQAQLLHTYRQGKLAVFTDEIYQDWILPLIGKEIVKGQTFLADLDHDELMQVADGLVNCEANKVILEKILSGEIIDPQKMDGYKKQVRDTFLKGGSKKFIEILKGEFKDLSIDVTVSIKGKQKDLAGKVDKLSNIFRTIFANPSILQDPTAVKILNQILEYSGLEPIDIMPYGPPQGQNDKSSARVSESMNYKDTPPDVQRQIEAQAGLQPSQAATQQPVTQ